MKPSTFISGWYAILPSHILKNKLMSLKRFGIDLVLWRQDNQQLSIFVDRCPHRGAKLSLGKVKYNQIECPFHGFQFNAQGQCAFAPEFNKPIPGLQAHRFETKEAFDMTKETYDMTKEAYDMTKETYDMVHMIESCHT